MANRFRLETAGDYRKVATARGDVALEWVDVYRGREAPTGYLFHWHGKKIAFETPYLGVNDVGAGRALIKRIEKFAEHGEVARALGLSPVIFWLPGARVRALTDAIEALLTLANSHRSVHRHLTHYCVVEVAGKVFALPDFDIDEGDLTSD